MKTIDINSGISIALLFIMAFLPHELILAQTQNAEAVKQKDTGIFKLALPRLTMSQIDTNRPTLNNCGKGLMYYECIIMNQQDKTHLFNYGGEEPPMVIKSTFTEMELETMNQNMLFLDKQCQIQIKEWIRKDKFDLNLGETIKGFYMKPVF